MLSYSCRQSLIVIIITIVIPIHGWICLIVVVPKDEHRILLPIITELFGSCLGWDKLNSTTKSRDWEWVWNFGKLVIRSKWRSILSSLGAYSTSLIVQIDGISLWWVLVGNNYWINPSLLFYLLLSNLNQSINN